MDRQRQVRQALIPRQGKHRSGMLLRAKTTNQADTPLTCAKTNRRIRSHNSEDEARSTRKPTDKLAIKPTYNSNKVSRMNSARPWFGWPAVLAVFLAALVSAMPPIKPPVQMASKLMAPISGGGGPFQSASLLMQPAAMQQQTNAPTPNNTEQPSYIATGRKISKILNDFFDKGYDKRVRPNYGGPPVNVNVTMRILSISSVSEVQMDFTADFYFRQTWSDPRLRFTRTSDIHTLFVGAEVSKRIWLPDTFFGNEKVAYFHEATTPNVFLRIDHQGEVYRSIRLTVTSSCPMKLQYFPMDRQQCTIEAESYGYNVKDIIYRWARENTAVERDKTISLPQFDIIKTDQKYRMEELSSGTYSRLVAEIHFARRMGYYLIQIYIPSSLIVVISWVSFWLHRNASPARVQLGVTTVLTMTTLMSSTNAALPKISYVKSIDVFLGTCFVMVFAALLEYATVGYLGKRIAMRKAHAQNVLSHALSMTQRMVAAQQQQQHTMAQQSPAEHQMQHQTSHPGGKQGISGLQQPASYSNAVQQFLNTASALPNLAAAAAAATAPGLKFDKQTNAALRAGTHLIPATKALGKGRQLDSIFGVRPSSIDKYSRVVFPVCFVCFQLMYWIVYLHISAFLESDGIENK